ncbi:MAG TPA: C25 family peptidase propeptide domain-containing protein, partial [bacterium]|nr:C25 family peptidase propeptide domain-containing protein [bacterium]
MSKKMSLLLIAGLVFSMATGTGTAGWLSQNAPIVQVTDSRWDTIAIDVDIDGLQSQEVKTKEGTYTRLVLDRDAYKGEIGSPRLPVIRKMVEVPYGAEIKLDYSVKSLKTLDVGSYRLVPVQAPVPKLPGALEAAPFDIDRQIYSQDRFLSEPEVRIVDIDFMRGHRLVVLEIAPVGYNPVQNQIRFADGFDIRLTMTGSDRELTQRMDYRYFNRAYDNLLSDKVLNHAAYRSRDYTFPPPAPVGYMILNVADFSSAIA